jgi:hypothetical protein
MIFETQQSQGGIIIIKKHDARKNAENHYLVEGGG